MLHVKVREYVNPSCLQKGNIESRKCCYDRSTNNNGRSRHEIEIRGTTPYNWMVTDWRGVETDMVKTVFKRVLNRWESKRTSLKSNKVDSLESKRRNVISVWLKIFTHRKHHLVIYRVNAGTDSGNKILEGSPMTDWRWKGTKYVMETMKLWNTK